LSPKNISEEEPYLKEEL